METSFLFTFVKNVRVFGKNVCVKLKSASKSAWIPKSASKSASKEKLKGQNSCPRPPPRAA